MKKIAIACMACLITLSMACKKERISGGGIIVSQERTLTDFTKIHTFGSTDVYVTQGANFKVEVKGYENLMAHFETNLNANTLEVGYKNNISINNDNIKVFVTMPVLNSLSISGSGNINTYGNFIGNVSFETHISGSGDISLSTGTTQNYISTISGSGNIRAFGLVAQDADISISGSGDNEVNATASLKIEIAGSGNVFYKNSPAINYHISGSGSVIPK